MADKSVSEYAESEVQKHASENDLWMIIDNGVYDVTKFIDEHPGGSDVLLEHAGTNATLAFEEVGHSADARVLLEKYKVGTIKAGSQKYCAYSDVWKYALVAIAGALVVTIVLKKMGKI